MRGAQRIFEVSGRIGGRKFVEVGVGDAGHFQRGKDSLAEKLQERHAGNFLDDDSGDNVIGVAVLPLGSRLEVERDLGPAIHDLFGGDRLQHERRHIILRPEVLITGGVREDLANGDLIAVGQTGDVLRDRIVERELALFRQQEDCGCGELLADRADAVAHLRRGRCVRIELSGTVGLDVGDLSILNDGDGRGGNAGGLQHLIGDVVDAGAQLRRE